MIKGPRTGLTLLLLASGAGTLLAQEPDRDGVPDTPAVTMNSGLFVDGPTEMAGMTVSKDLLADLHFPTLYILGGELDIAYPNGGAAARVVVDWLAWQLRGSREASWAFLGPDCGLCTDPEWELETKGLGSTAPR